MQLLKAFSVVLKGQEKVELKNNFIDKIDYDLWKDKEKGSIIIWKKIYDEFLKIYASNNDSEKEELKVKLAKLAPMDVKASWFGNEDDSDIKLVPM